MNSDTLAAICHNTTATSRVFGPDEYAQAYSAACMIRPWKAEFKSPSLWEGTYFTIAVGVTNHPVYDYERKLWGVGELLVSDMVLMLRGARASRTLEAKLLPWITAALRSGTPVVEGMVKILDAEGLFDDAKLSS